MKAKNVILFVYDEKSHFELNTKGLGEDTFKKIIRIENITEFENELEKLNNNELIFLITHVFFTKEIKGIKNFLASGITDKYHLLGYFFVSDGKKNTIEKEIIDEMGSDFLKNTQILKYYEVRKYIENKESNIYTKEEIIENNRKIKSPEEDNLNNDECIDYIIITALEEDEMEKILPLITKIKKIPNDKHLISIGYFNSKPEKKVVYASQISTGMIDASILATELIVRFNPKFIIMTGVLGGRPEKTNLGDVIISNKVFTIDKGKLNETEFQHEIESTNTMSSYSTEILREKKNIIEFISIENQIYNQKIEIHFEPIACVRHVIDKEGYFVENISSIDRKTIGLEMESYGIARACEIVNNGNTIPLIIKSVMDNTQNKTDGAKKFAAWTSAKVLEYIIKNDII